VESGIPLSTTITTNATAIATAADGINITTGEEEAE
jgi:hypothetical protein